MQSGTIAKLKGWKGRAGGGDFLGNECTFLLFGLDLPLLYFNLFTFCVM